MVEGTVIVGARDATLVIPGVGLDHPKMTTARLIQCLAVVLGGALLDAMPLRRPSA